MLGTALSPVDSDSEVLLEPTIRSERKKITQLHFILDIVTDCIFGLDDEFL